MEKRLYPRVDRRFSAVVENEKGAHLVDAMDTSSEGLCIQCNTFVRDLITPGGRFVSDDGKPVELFICLELPFEGRQAEKIRIRCHVAFSRRISSDQCKIGMRYMDLEEDEYQTLIEYIVKVMDSKVMKSNVQPRQICATA